MKKVIALFTIINILPLKTFANESLLSWESLIDTFTRCDTSFFSDIYERKEQLNELATVKEFGPNQAHIHVADRTDYKSNYHYFSAPLTYKNLNIIGYYDSVINLDKYGDYYFWGFIFDHDDIQEIAQIFSHLEWQNMEDGKLYIAQPLIRYAQDNLNEWQINTGTIVGVKTIPASGTAEKLLLLEKGQMTSLLCSIQGHIPLELLNLERPDIERRANYNFQ